MEKICNTIIVLLVAASMALTACASAPPVEPPPLGQADEICVRPESDNAHSWKLGTCVVISTQAFHVVARTVDGLESHTEVHASGSSTVVGSSAGVYGSGSFRMWQSGKGVLPVEIISVAPDFPGVSAGDLVLLKITDLKALGLPVGARTEFVCNQDVEAVSPITSGLELTTDRVAYELDDCRMKSPVFHIDS